MVSSCPILIPRTLSTLRFPSGWWLIIISILTCNGLAELRASSICPHVCLGRAALSFLPRISFSISRIAIRSPQKRWQPDLTRIGAAYLFARLLCICLLVCHQSCPVISSSAIAQLALGASRGRLLLSGRLLYQE